MSFDEILDQLTRLGEQITNIICDRMVHPYWNLIITPPLSLSLYLSFFLFCRLSIRSDVPTAHELFFILFYSTKQFKRNKTKQNGTERHGTERNEQRAEAESAGGGAHSETHQQRSRFISCGPSRQHKGHDHHHRSQRIPTKVRLVRFLACSLVRLLVCSLARLSACSLARWYVFFFAPGVFCHQPHPLEIACSYIYMYIYLFSGRHLLYSTRWMLSST